MSQIPKPCDQAFLDDMLRDPLVRAVMQADRVDAEELRALLARVARNRPAPEVEISLEPYPDPRYRMGVGIVLYNRSGKVLIGQRADTAEAAWQMPQGGIEWGETPLAAARRELKEEIGTANVEVLAESRGWLRYELPSEFAHDSRHGNWRGQQQKWFAMLFRGEDSEIDLGWFGRSREKPEFLRWQWAPAAGVAELIVAFKRPLYRGVLAEFERIGPVDTGENRLPPQ